MTEIGGLDYNRELEPLLGQAAAYARSLLRNRNDAEDAVQQAALRGLERIGTFDATRAFKGWWFAVLRNCCIDILRGIKAQKTRQLESYAPPDANSRGVEDWELLCRAMEELSDEHCEILRLRYFAELSYRDLAEALLIPQGTVMSRLHLARRALAAQIR